MKTNEELVFEDDLQLKHEPLDFEGLAHIFPAICFERYLYEEFRTLQRDDFGSSI